MLVADVNSGFIDEEERKRRQAASLAAGLGAGVKVAAKVAPRPLPSVAAPIAPVARKVTPLANNSRVFFTQRAETAKTTQETTHPSPLAAYFQLARQVGGTAEANQRLKEVASIWRRYFKPYKGDSLVYSMMMSPYSIAELEGMARKGSLAIAGGMGASGRNYIPQSSMSKSKDAQTADALFGAQETTRKRNEAVYFPEQMPAFFESSAKPEEDLLSVRADTSEQWWTEWAQTGPKPLIDIEALTGLKRTDFRTWHEWESAVRESKNDLDFAGSEKLDHAYDQYVQARDKWTMDKHGGQEALFGLAGLGEVATAAATALSVYAPGGFFGSKVTGRLAEMGLNAATKKAISAAAEQAARETARITGKSITEIAVKEAGQLAIREAVGQATSQFGRMWTQQSLGTKWLSRLGLPGRVAAGTAALGTGFAAASAPAAMTVGQKYNPAARQEVISDELMSEYYASQELTDAQIAAKQHQEYIMSIATGLDGRERILAMQAEAQTPQYDEEGNLTRKAYGTGLVAEGLPTPEWLGVFDEMREDDMRAVAQWQSGYIASGEGGWMSADLEITGSLYKWDGESETWIPDPVWMPRYDEYMVRQAEEMKYFNDHLYLYAVQEITGIPLTGWFLNKKLGQLTAEGGAYMPLKAMLDVALIPGNTIRAARSLGAMGYRMSRDPGREHMESQLVEYANAAIQKEGLTEDEAGMSLDPESMTASKAQLLIESGLLTDVATGMLVKQRQQDTARKLSEVLGPGGGSWIELFGNMGGADTTSLRAFCRTNYNFVDGMNVLGDIIGQMALTQGSAAMKRPIMRTIESVSDSRVATRDLTKIVDMFDKPTGGLVDGTQFAKIVNGQDAQVLFRRAVDERNGVNEYAVDAKPVVDLAAEVAVLARQAKRAEIIALMTPEFAKSESGLRMVDNWIAAAAAKEKTATTKTVVNKETVVERVPYEGNRLDAYNKGYMDAVQGTEHSLATRVWDYTVNKTITKSYDEGYTRGKTGETAAPYKEVSRVVRTPGEDVTVYRGKPIEEQIAKAIVARQVGRVGVRDGRGDIFGVKNVSDFLVTEAAKMFSGENGTHYNVFTHWDSPGTRKMSRMRMRLENIAKDLPVGRTRTIYNAFFAGWYKAPLPKTTVEIKQTYADNVKNVVMNVTHNASTAAWWGTRALLLDGENHQAVAKFKFDLAKLRGDKLNLGSRVESRLEGLLNTSLSKETSVDRTIGARWSEEMPAKGEAPTERVGEYTDVKGQKRQVTMLTTQEAKTLNTPRSDMYDSWAIPENANAAVKLWFQTRNVTRRAEAALMALNTPMRIVSVGAGFVVLFQKHSITDSARTIAIMGPGPLLRFHKNLADYRATLAKLSPDEAAHLELRKAQNDNGELHYMDEGGGSSRWKHKRVFNDRGMPLHMRDGVRTVRRVITDRGFMIWAKDGDEALAKWISSDEGIKWLKASDQTRQFKAYLKANKMELGDTAFLDAAAANYLQMRASLFGDYESTAKHLYAAMKKMAAGELPAHSHAIEAELKRAYKSHNENPVLDIQSEFGGIAGPFAWLTKMGMAPNRFNRSAVFLSQFNHDFARLTNDNPNMSVGDASRIAAESAVVKTSQIHFDLAEAYNFEIKHRWFAYFGTKHRLWNTWLAKTAIKNPLYSAAVSDLMQWMEDRNESDPTTPEWERYNVTLHVGGKKQTFNMASRAWLIHAAPESTMGSLFERGLLEGVNTVLGTDLMPSPNKYQYSVTRLDQTFRTMHRLVTSPGFMANTEATQETVTKYIDGLPAKEKNKLTDQMATLWALDPDKTVEECFKEVLRSNTAANAMSFLSPASDRFYTEETYDLLKQQNEFEALPDDQRGQFLEDHPEIAMTMGAQGRDPYVHRQLVAALTDYRRIRNAYTQAITTAFYTGQIEEPGYGNDLFQQQQIEIDNLKRTNPVFDNWMKVTREQTYIENIKYLFPVLEIEEIEKMRMPTFDEEQRFKEPLIAAATEVLNSYGIPYSSNSPLARMVKHNMIEVPTMQFTGELPDDLSAGEKNNYRILAMGGAEGMFRKTQYIEMMLNNRKREAWMGGLTEGKADTDNLLMMFLSPQEKEFMGVRPSEDAQKAWEEYAYLYTMVREQLDLAGIKAVSKDGKMVIQQATEAKLDELFARSPEFRWEWALSNMDTRDRFEALGYADGTRPAAKSWRYFFDTIDIMWDDLYAADLTTTEGAGAAAIVHRARRLLSKVTTDEAFMREWKLLGLSLPKFGIRAWHLSDKPDWDLYSNDPSDAAPDIYQEGY